MNVCYVGVCVYHVHIISIHLYIFYSLTINYAWIHYINIMYDFGGGGGRGGDKRIRQINFMN